MGHVGRIHWSRIVPFAFVWILACIGLSIHWRVNPQYHFGWFVPLLAFYAGLGRWRTRPEPGPPMPGAAIFGVLVAITILPSWFVALPNSDWPLLNWLLAFQAVAITLAGLGMVGGWPWVRHFFAPVALIFTAVPWPDAIENPFTQAMMRLVAGVAVNLLDLVGVAALQHGNLIEIGHGLVGVDEACSGIRSIQGALMASIVLGELYRFDGLRRVLLVIVSLAVAFVTNVFRAAFLAWSAARSGLTAIERWHDPAGMTILAVCVGLIYVVAIWLDGGSVPPRATATTRSAVPIPKWFAAGLAVWLCLVLVAAELWYRDTEAPPQNPLRAQLPPSAEQLPIPVGVRAAFHSDAATAARWQGRNGTGFLLYFFEWKFGAAFSRVTAGLHRPDICLPAGGREMVEDRGSLAFATAKSELPFHAYSFRDGDGLIFVYHGVWQSRTSRGLSHGAFAAHKRLAAIQAVLWRERRVGQQSAEIIIWGCRDAAAADAALRESLPGLIVARSSPTL